jgi:hypothetical protein
MLDFSAAYTAVDVTFQPIDPQASVKSAAAYTGISISLFPRAEEVVLVYTPVYAPVTPGLYDMGRVKTKTYRRCQDVLDD